MGGRGQGRLRSGGGYGGGGAGAGGGMSKRGGAAKRGGRFLSVEEEDRLRTNVLRRNSLNNQGSSDREEGSEMDATDVLVQVIGPDPSQNDSVLERVRRLEGGQGGSNQSLDNTVDVGARRNEFDFGRSMALISEQLRRGVGSIVEKISGQAMDADSIRTATVDGLKVMVEALEAVMNGLSDSVQKERLGSERVEEQLKGRILNVEQRVQETENKLEVLKRSKDRQVWKESVKDMTSKIGLGDRQLKYVDIDYGRVTNSKREIVEKTIAYMKEDAGQDGGRRLEVIMRRTRFILLGKETVLRTLDDQNIYTVPVLLEFRSVNDKVEVEEMLREVGWYPVYHWPKECMEFVKDARLEVRRMGFQEDRYFVKIRPDWRDGAMEIRGEVKENRAGGRFRTVAIWDVPPADVNLWTREQGRPRKTFILGGQ